MLRTLVIKFFPGLAARFEEESRNWKIHCPQCEHEVSVWDAGDIRYKAFGTVHRWVKCPSCGESGMLRIYRPD